MTRPARRPLTDDDPIEAWNAQAEEIGEPGLTGEILRKQTLLADRILDEIISEDLALATWNGLPPGTWAWQKEEK